MKDLLNLNYLISEKNPTLIENLVYTDKNSFKKEHTISSKAKSVESTFSSLISQDNSFFFSIAKHLTHYNSSVCCTFEDVERS